MPTRIRIITPEEKAKDDTIETCCKELWEALGFSSDMLPNSGWENALEAVRKQTKQLSDVKKAIR